MSANVNKPTNVKVKEADVNRKLQLYGIFNAFQNGKVPSVSCNPGGALAPFGANWLIHITRTTKSM